MGNFHEHIWGNQTSLDTVRETELAFVDAADQPIHEFFRLLAEDQRRTALVCDDVLAALAEGRRCLVLSSGSSTATR